jgi:hypothetical protein
MSKKVSVCLYVYVREVGREKRVKEGVARAKYGRIHLKTTISTPGTQIMITIHLKTTIIHRAVSML